MFWRHGEGSNDVATPEYRAWTGMLSRCRNRGHAKWDNYGGRGITVCERWLRFENFLEDMGRRPSARHTLDRLDNNQLVDGYSKANCRWATWIEQGRNRRGNHIIEINGITKILSEWLVVTGVARTTFNVRVKSGWSKQAALCTATRSSKPQQELNQILGVL